jgi:glycosyltransferase involved in cell wall biosynthesis
VDGIVVHRIQYPRIKVIGAIILNFRFVAWLIRNQREFDTIHIHMMHNLAGAAGWAKRWLQPRVLVKVSGAAEFQGGILDPSLKHKPIHRALLAGTKRLDFFQCISQHTYNIMLEAGYPAQRLHLIPNAVDCNRFKPSHADTDSAFRVVFVGRHVRVKGLDVLLRAWALLERPINARLVLAGDGPEHQRLIALCQQLGLSESVEFPGLVHDVPALLAQAHLYVQASHQEGLPNSVLEAMAAGLAVVATRVSGHEDVVMNGKTGLLVPAGDPITLASALQKLIVDAALRRRMGFAGRETVSLRFSTPAIIEQLLTLYVGKPPTTALPTNTSHESNAS